MKGGKFIKGKFTEELGPLSLDEWVDYVTGGEKGRVDYVTGSVKDMKHLISASDMARIAPRKKSGQTVPTARIQRDAESLAESRVNAATMERQELRRMLADLGYLGMDTPEQNRETEGNSNERERT